MGVRILECFFPPESTAVALGFVSLKKKWWDVISELFISPSYGAYSPVLGMNPVLRGFGFFLKTVCPTL